MNRASLLVLVLSGFLSASTFAESVNPLVGPSAPNWYEGDDVEHTRMLGPEDFWNQFGIFAVPRYKFSQTIWGECSEAITGNYSGYSCSDRRNISTILKTFLNDYLFQCLNKGLAAQGGGAVASLHIEHDGITGDANHSPRSLHAENRAIDVKAFHIVTTDGRRKKWTYAGTTNRSFYTAFRRCWGTAIHSGNGCPYYSGQSLLTGSIGWENADHRNHMHLSVPYCVGGSYGSGYYQR
ncbi:MAG: hypothetical protein AB7F86_03610 [Bdellovibrionales bacterium]